MASQKVAPVEWLTREEAATLLGRAVRTIDAWRKAGVFGQDGVREMKAPGHRQVAPMISAAAVERQRARQSDPLFRIHREQPKPKLIAPPRPRPPEPTYERTWLTLEEVVQRETGLTVAFLRRQIEQGRLPACDLLEGTGAPGPSYRVKLADVQAMPGIRYGQTADATN
jgi:hypothetical protein